VASSKHQNTLLPALLDLRNPSGQLFYNSCRELNHTMMDNLTADNKSDLEFVGEKCSLGGPRGCRNVLTITLEEIRRNWMGTHHWARHNTRSLRILEDIKGSFSRCMFSRPEVGITRG
jgi:hypothetical protein